MIISSRLRPRADVPFTGPMWFVYLNGNINVKKIHEKVVKLVTNIIRTSTILG